MQKSSYLEHKLSVSWLTLIRNPNGHCFSLIIARLRFDLHADCLKTGMSLCCEFYVVFFLSLYVTLRQRALFTWSSAYIRDGVPFPFEHNPLLLSTQCVFMEMLRTDYKWCFGIQSFPLVNLILYCSNSGFSERIMKKKLFSDGRNIIMLKQREDNHKHFKIYDLHK